MNFDLSRTLIQADGRKVDYGIVYGNHHVVIIKAGAGGSCVGDEEKYVKMARMLHESYGCTVISLSNYENDSFERTDVALLRELLSHVEGEAKLYYFGNSNGSTQGLLFATKYFDFQRMVLINMPLMLNFHKTKEALARVNTDILFLYGEKDPSFAYVPFLRHASQKPDCRARVDMETVPQADHNFAGMTDVFVELGRYVFRDGSTTLHGS